MSQNRVVDIAVLAEDVKSAPVEFDGHLVDLEPMDISECVFREIFYASNGNELFILNCTNSITVTCSGEDISVNPFNYMTFNKLNYMKTGDSTELSFNLINEVLTRYADDLGVLRDCFEPCSLIDIEKQLNAIRNLCDICDVKCSLKWSDVIATIKSLGGSVSNGKIHRLRVNALFTNANPQVKDIMVRFNYDVALTQSNT